MVLHRVQAICLCFIMLMSFALLPPKAAHAETATSEFALFKRTMTPVWQWGENGILTVPKANPIGKYKIYGAMSGFEAGTIQDEKLYNTNLSVVIGTSDDAEIGYTRRQLIWENGDRTDLQSDMFHIKARVLHIADSVIPQVSIGVIGTSLRENQFSNKNDVLFNPFLATTINIPLFSENFVFALTGTAETVYMSGESSDTFYNAGVDLSLFNKVLTVGVEYQGISKKHAEEIMNAGAKLKLFNMLNIGVGKFNMSQSKTDKSIVENNSYMIYFVSLEVPLSGKEGRN